MFVTGSVGDSYSVSSILIVDDKPSMRKVLKQALDALAVNVDTATNGEDALDRMKQCQYDIVVTDLRMPKMDGIGLLRMGSEVSPSSKFIVVTAYGTIEKAVEAMRLGAHDFISKPFNLDEFELKVRRLIRSEPAPSTGDMLGSSQQMEEVRQFIRKVAPSNSPVLITGETGTGKELVARSIHTNSQRREGTFIAVNCSALPATLLESELFGHEKGAFTRADRRKKGRFELADGGTLFLDEIADMEHAVQSKLLRAVEMGEIDRVGGTEPVRVDVRLVAATNKDIHEEASAGTFREDLYYRLNVFAIHIPPLRERPEDISPIVLRKLADVASELGKDISGFSDETMALLKTGRWPGNVRELLNCVEHAAVLAENDRIELADLPPRMTAEVSCGQASDDLQGQTEEFERKRICDALERHKWNRTRAAEELGIKRTTLQYKIRKYGLD